MMEMRGSLAIAAAGLLAVAGCNRPAPQEPFSPPPAAVNEPLAPPEELAGGPPMAAPAEAPPSAEADRPATGPAAAMAPIANPPVEAAAPFPTPAPVAKAPVRKVPVANTPSPPTATRSAAPAVTAKAPPPSAPIPLAARVARGAVLTLSPELARGGPGVVTLALPVSLSDAVRAEAARLGLARAARKVQVSAALTGQGFAITPGGRQTAALKAGEPVTLSWAVAPVAGPKGPLKAEVDAILSGVDSPRRLALGSIQSSAAQTAAAAQDKPPGFHLPRGGLLGGDAPDHVKFAAVLGFVALAILATAMARSLSERRRLAARRRRAQPPAVE